MGDVLNTFIQRVMDTQNRLNAEGFRPSAIRISSRTRDILKSDSALEFHVDQLPETLLGLPVHATDVKTLPAIPDQICSLPVVIDDTIPDMDLVVEASQVGYCERERQAIRITTLSDNP